MIKNTQVWIPAPEILNEALALCIWRAPGLGTVIQFKPSVVSALLAWLTQPSGQVCRAFLTFTCARAKSLQSCPSLCNPVDCSPPDSSVHGILQARTLERLAISFSRGPSQPRDRTHISFTSCFGRWVLYCSANLGSPSFTTRINLVDKLA